MNLAPRLPLAGTSLECRTVGQGRVGNRSVLPAEGAGEQAARWSLPASPSPLPLSGCPTPCGLSWSHFLLFSHPCFHFRSDDRLACVTAVGETRRQHVRPWSRAVRGALWEPFGTFTLQESVVRTVVPPLENKIKRGQPAAKACLANGMYTRAHMYAFPLVPSYSPRTPKSHLFFLPPGTPSL